MRTNPNHPAFSEILHHGNHVGLTKREHFAVMAMNGMIGAIWPSNDDAAEIAIRSTMMADALIEALNKEAE